MNMQSQLQAAIAAAEKTLDDSSVASPVPGAANHDGGVATGSNAYSNWYM